MQALRALIETDPRTLNELGIGRGDRVAIVLPNGPEMATAFVAVASAATAAPLNPGLSRRRVRVLPRRPQGEGADRRSGQRRRQRSRAAEKLGVAIIDAHPGTRRSAAGAFALSARRSARQPARPGPVEPRRHRARPAHLGHHLAAEDRAARPGQHLRPRPATSRRRSRFPTDDRGLNIMPLFHIHGLIAALSAPLSRGGAVFCTPGFNALKFFAWIEEAKPTWYTAVPTMHQAILTRAAPQARRSRRHPLRFIRSSSSSLPPQVIGELEAAFGCPVIEAYGMTEAAHQMASNPLRRRAQARQRRPRRRSRGRDHGRAGGSCSAQARSARSSSAART